MPTKTMDELTKVKLRQAFMTRDADAFEDLMGKSEEKKPEAEGTEEKKPEEGGGNPFAKKEEGGAPPAGGEAGGEGKIKPTEAPPASPEGGTHHHIVINVHGQGTGGVPGATGGGSGVDVQDPTANGAGVPQIGPTDEGGATRVGADPTNPGGAGGSMGDPDAEGEGDPVEMIMSAIKKLAARITALEQKGGGAQPQAQPQAQAQPEPKPPGADKPTTQDDGEAGGTDMSGSIAVENKGDVPKVEQDAGIAPSGTKPEAEGPKGADGVELEKDMITKEDHTGAVGEAADKPVTKDDDLQTPTGAPGPELEKDMVTKDDAQAPAGSPGAELAKGAGIRTRDRVRTKDGSIDARVAVREREAWQNAMSMAEILAPGCKLPTFDAALSPVDVQKNLCNFKRSVLDSSWNTASGQSVMRLFIGDEAPKPKITSMTCDAVDILFSASARALSRDYITSSVQHGAAGARQAAINETKVPTPAELNAQYANFYKDKI